MKRLFHISALSCLALSLFSTNLLSQTFVEQTDIILPGLKHSAVAWGDYDNDRDLDVLIAGFTNSNYQEFYLYRNDGGNNFSDQTSGFSPAVPSAIKYSKRVGIQWADFNNDGYLDVMYAGFNSNAQNVVYIYQNDGTNSFTQRGYIDYLSPDDSSVDLADYDNDGDIDLLVTLNSETKIYANQGNFDFDEQTGISIIEFKKIFANWGDYDNDGDDDILFLGWSDLSYSPIYKNMGDNNFELQTGITSFPELFSSTSDWGDYNNDGFLDLLVTGDNETWVYKNNGNNSFTKLSGQNISGVGNGYGKWGDLDNDGDLDLIISGNELTEIYYNNGDESFSLASEESLDGFSSCAIDLGDYDNDDDLDIIISGSSGSSTACKVYRNEEVSSNHPPDAPNGLSEVSSGNDIILSWNSVLTDNTAANALSYNIMVGSSPGGSDIINPGAASSGYFRSSGMGNTQLGTSFILRNLPIDTYYWRVQAIDNSYKGGAFSSESSFNYNANYQAYNLNASVVGGQETTLSWTRGNGDNCIVFMREGSTGTALPVDHTSYTEFDVFGVGSQIGSSGWYCVYKGSESAIHVTGLKPLTEYIVQVQEFNGSPGNEVFNNLVSESNSYTYKTGIFSELMDVNLAPVNFLSTNASQSPFCFWMDFDNDDDLDFLIISDFGRHFYKNNNGDNFSEVSIGLTNEKIAACGDFNNDGFIDIVAASGSDARIFKNNGNSTFSILGGTSIPGVNYGSLNWGDYDNDGDLDLILSGQSGALGRITKIYRNNGDETFTDVPNLNLPQLTFGYTDWGDFDNDEYLDLAISGVTLDGSYISRVYKNDQKGGFTEHSNFSTSIGKVEWGDYDNDGDLDILFTCTDGNKVYQNDGNGSFVEQSHISFERTQHGMARWGDYNNDGYLDIIVTGSRYSLEVMTKLFRNNKDNTFQEDTDCQLTPAAYSNTACGDYDNDGDLDIMLLGVSANSAFTKLYRNDIVSSNPVPVAPVGLSSEINKSEVKLSWNSVRSDNTGYLGMSYNLKVGTVSGGIDIAAPHAGTNGYRRLAEIGNGNLDTTFILKDLPFGTYFWSVQAVDNGFTGGNFSSEGSFDLVPVQAANLSAEIISNTSLLLRWERGNGRRCVVFCKETVSDFASPLDNKSYISDNEFGYGEQLGSTGWYCIYNGRSDSCVVTGLTYKTNYSFHVIECMGEIGSEQYFPELINGNPGIFSTGLFSEQTSISLSNPEWSEYAWGDYNNDGLIDLLIPGQPTILYKNNGDNTFSEESAAILPDGHRGCAVWGDYDNDGDLDILISGATSSYPTCIPAFTSIYRNDGFGIFSEQNQIVLEQVYHSSADWGDYDNDGDLDLILTGARNSNTNFDPVSLIYMNNGDETFSAQTQIILPQVCRGTSDWVDYDNDGDLDLHISGGFDNSQSNNISSIFKNNGDNTFSEQTQIVLPGLWESSADWCDYDHDGDMDVVMTKPGILYIYQNDGETFSPFLVENNHAYSSTGTAVWGDYDNDGFMDIFFSHFTAVAQIYKNNNGESFTIENEGSFQIASIDQMKFCDYDNDGDIDILVVRDEYDCQLYKNNLIMKSGLFSANSLPDAPGGIVARYFPEGVTLNWDPVENDETPSPTMSYNVRIGTSPGAIDICSPNAETSGFSRIVELGNASLDTSYFAKNLPTQTYYWSVQAIDQGFKGGEWSEEGSFEVKTIQAFFTFDTVCLGLTTQFSDLSVSTGGILSWDWDFGDGTNSGLENPGHIFSTAGNHTVKLVIHSAESSDSVTNNVLVLPKPLANFTADPVCEGNPTTIVNTTDVNGTTVSGWFWNFGDGDVSFLQNPSSHGYLNPGDYTVLLVATASNACVDSIQKSVVVSEYPAAVIASSSSLTFCDGNNVELSVEENAMYNYQWKIDGTNLASANQNNYTANSTGSYTVEVENTDGNCVTLSGEASVTANSAPPRPLIILDGDSQFCAGDSVRLSVAFNPDYSYSWKLNGGAVGTNSNELYAKYSGDYTIELENSSGCDATSNNTVTVTVFESPVTPTVGINGDTAFCQGESVELSVTNNPLMTYQWMEGEFDVGGATTNSYTATTTGNYKLKVISDDGCVVETQVVQVIADPAPTAPTIGYTGALEFCDVDSLVLSVADNPNYTYEWLLNGGTVSTVSSSYTARATGDYTVKLKNLGDCYATSANTVSLTVHASPASPTLNLSGPTTFCEDKSLTLSVSEPGTDSYQWLSELGEMTDSTGTSITVDETGQYKVRVRNTGLCEAFSQEIAVTVNAYPTTPVILTENYTLDACQEDDPVILSVETVEMGAVYQWSRNGIPISGAGSSTLTGYLEEGDYTVEAISNTCGVESQTLTIRYGEMPDRPEIIAEGPTIWYLACSNDSATAYKWYLDGELIEGADEYLYVAGTQEGKFEVAISKEGSCFAKSDPLWIPLGTGIDLDPWENLKIYPNPTPGMFTLEMDNHIMGELIIDIFGETGSKIINIKFHKETTHFKTQIDLSGQPPAAYLIGLMLDKYRTNRTLIVE